MDALECLVTRRSAPQLVEPGPDEHSLRTLFEAAVAAPDHGRLRPWRFVVVRGEAREGLGSAFAAAHAEREPHACEAELARTRAKPFRAPLLIVVIADPKPTEKVPGWEQVASAACAAQNVLLAVHALGLGAMWRTGWLASAPKVRAHLGLRPNEQIVAFLYVGTVPPGTKAQARPPVGLARIVTEL